MTNEEIYTLAKAGFTAAQIAALNQTGAAKPGVKEPPKPGVKEPPKQEEKKTDRTDEILEMLRLNNLRGAEQPKRQTTDEILAEIINPKENKQDGE